MHGADDAPVRSQGRVCVFTATGSLINSWRGTRKLRLFAAAGADRRRIGNSLRRRDPAVVLMGRGLLDVELGQSRP
jgi:hypothetical protein